MGDSEGQRETAVNVANLHDCLKVVGDFLRAEVLPQLRENDGHTALQVTAYGLLGRMSAWVDSLIKLDSRTDFQATLAGLRSLLEITVDLVLLYKVPANLEKLEAWERSAKLKQAEALVRFHDGRRQPVPKSWHGAVEFINNEKAKIDAERVKHWGQASHPRTTWTGSDLLTNARAADKYIPALKLEEFYETFYRFICWNVHGSGLTILRNTTEDAVYAWAGIAFKQCAEFAFWATEVVLRIFDDFGTANQKRLVFVRERWVVAFGGYDMTEVQDERGNEVFEIRQRARG